MIMKKVYFSIASLALCATAWGQNLTKEYNFGADGKITTPKTQPSVVAIKPSTPAQKEEAEKALNVLWTEDFGGTTALTTPNGVYTAAGNPGVYWSLGSTHPMSTYGYADNLTGRFLTWNSFGPIYPNEPANGFATTPVDGEVVTPAIDLSGGANGIVMTFKTEAMYCCNATEIPFAIAISEDDGATWSTPIPVDLGVDRNQPTEDIAQPMDVSVDLSTLTTNLSTTSRIKFIWDGVNTDQNGQANSHYFWLIDDIQIYEKPNYNLELADAWLGDIVSGYEYTSIPTVFAGNLTVQAKIRNLGKLTPTNTALTVTVTGPGGVNVTQTGGVLTNDFSLEADTITFATTIDMSTFAAGTYTVAYTLGMTEVDENTADNDFTRTFKITDGVYGQTDLQQPLYFGSIGKDQGATNTESTYMGVGSVFYIPTDADLHGINLKVGRSTNYPTTVGSELYVTLYLVDFTNATTFNDAHITEAGDWYFPITTSMYPSSNNSSKDVILNFHQATGTQTIPTLLSGNYYLALIQHDGGADNHFCYLENPFDDDASTHVFGDFGSTAGNNWFTLGTQVVSELNLNQTLNVGELASDVTVGFIAPNPTSGETTVVYSLKNDATVTIQVVDVTGKVVATVTENNLTAGTQKTSFDASNLSSGVYYVNINTGNSVATQKFIKK
jgi:hypothetical protein